MELTVKEAEAEWMLGLLPKEVLPKLAQEWLCQSSEVSSVLDLAITDPDDIHILDLFKKVIVDIVGKEASMIDALRFYAARISAQIVESKISPLMGAKMIWHASLNAKMKDFHDYDAFIYAASEIDDRPNEKEFFENEIFKEAQRWSVSATI